MDASRAQRARWRHALKNADCRSMANRWLMRKSVKNVGSPIFLSIFVPLFASFSMSPLYAVRGGGVKHKNAPSEKKLRDGAINMLTREAAVGYIDGVDGAVPTNIRRDIMYAVINYNDTFPAYIEFSVLDNAVRYARSERDTVGGQVRLSAMIEVADGVWSLDHNCAPCLPF